MSYSSLSIKQIVLDITDKKYYLPAIQRKFVWGEEKICKLFDSIMRDYPIGTFLFWELKKELASKYTFYEFLTNYDERDSKNKLVRYDLPKDIRGVLDGQQRLSSLYIALQGIYCTKRKYARSDSKGAYPERQFYFDLLGDDENYIFKFLSDEDAGKSSEKHYYYLVRDILIQPKDVDPYDIIDELKLRFPERASILDANMKSARKKLTLLNKKLNEDKLINYFQIKDKELDDVLDIFVRVNSGGTILSKSDLLFSTLVAHWEDGRDQVEKLISDMNGDDNLFGFNTDFLMRTCLFLVDAPMNFRLKTFDSNNIIKIRDNWQNIRDALIDSASLLREYGFNKSRLTSNYAATPLAYYFFKGGVKSDATKTELAKLVKYSLLKQIYSGQADAILRVLRAGLREKSANDDKYVLQDQEFNFAKYSKIKLPSGKRFTVDAQDVDYYLEQKKGSGTFLVLSLLYPALRLDQIQFHQDHMHPSSRFTTKDLNNAGVDSKLLDHWKNLKDQLPNLQLLEGQENIEKRAIPLKDWVSKKIDNELYYRELNYISETQSLSLAYFECFFEARKQRMKNELYKLFEVVLNESEDIMETISVIDTEGEIVYE